MDEAEELDRDMRALAAKWRRVLADPVVQQQVEAGAVVISPLVRELLKLYPPAGTRPTGG